VGARRGFRHRARLAVRGRQGRAKIGIFAQGSHRVVDIPACEIHHPLINRVATALKRAMRQLESSSYSDSAHLGLVRGLQVAVERSSQTAQIVLICNAASSESARPLLECLERELAEAVHSLWWNGNPDVTNRILGDSFERIVGPECLTEELGGASVFFPPGAFGQNNLDLFERVVKKVHGLVPDGRHVVELYAGSGALGLGLSARVGRLVFNEINPASLAGLARGIAALPPQGRARVQVIPGPAQDAASQIETDSVVIVDPPRKGLDPELLTAFAERAPERVVYLSCDLTSLIRDSQLLEARGLSLTSATGYDLFPYTEHIETLAHFQRVR
jgi:23S rRNA (uracil1939-C5)-methyltransferase